MALLTSEWMEETQQTCFWPTWDGYYLAECPHGEWTVWDAFRLIPLCACEEEAA